MISIKVVNGGQETWYDEDDIIGFSLTVGGIDESVITLRSSPERSLTEFFGSPMSTGEVYADGSLLARGQLRSVSIDTPGEIEYVLTPISETKPFLQPEPVDDAPPMTCVLGFSGDPYSASEDKAPSGYSAYALQVYDSDILGVSMATTWLAPVWGHTIDLGALVFSGYQQAPFTGTLVRLSAADTTALYTHHTDITVCEMKGLLIPQKRSATAPFPFQDEYRGDNAVPFMPSTSVRPDGCTLPEVMEWVLRTTGTTWDRGAMAQYAREYAFYIPFLSFINGYPSAQELLDVVTAGVPIQRFDGPNGLYYRLVSPYPGIPQAAFIIGKNGVERSGPYSRTERANSANRFIGRYKRVNGELRKSYELAGTIQEGFSGVLAASQRINGVITEEIEFETWDVRSVKRCLMLRGVESARSRIEVEVSVPLLAALGLRPLDTVSLTDDVMGVADSLWRIEELSLDLSRASIRLSSYAL